MEPYAFVLVTDDRSSRHRPVVREAVGGYIADVMEGRSSFVLRLGGRAESFFTAFVVWMPANRWHGRNTRCRCCYSTCWAPSWSIRCSGLQFWLPFNPQHFAAVSRTPLSTRPSVSSPTPTGRATRASRPWAIWCRWPAWRAELLSAATASAWLCRDPRICATQCAEHRQLLGRPHSSEPLRVAAAAVVLALALASQGVIQNFHAYKDATTLEKLTFQNPKNRHGR